MKDLIYCFSGTGNSLYVAKSIQKEINAQLIMLNNQTLDQPVPTVIECLGIIFPVYHQSIPLIINRFILALASVQVNYIYAICTCGDSPTLALKHLDHMLASQNKSLNAGFSVKMPYNYIKPSKIGKGFYDSFGLTTSTDAHNEKLDMLYQNRKPEILNCIKDQKDYPYEKNAVIIETLVEWLNLKNTLQKQQWFKIAGYTGMQPKKFVDSLPLMDSGFHSNNKCVSCGICKKICPVNNIEYVTDENTNTNDYLKPVWLHHCEQCFACLQWCPHEAIEFGKGTKDQKRYHHPKITLKEMIEYKEANYESKNMDY